MYVVIETDKHRRVVDVVLKADRKHVVEYVTNLIDALGLYSLDSGELKADQLDSDLKFWVDDNGLDGELVYEHSGGGYLTIMRRFPTYTR